MGTAIVIDDDIFFCNLLTDILESLNLEVASYKSPEEYFFRLQSDEYPAHLTCPDLILTDNRMPGMSGLEFLAKLKEMGCKLPAQRTAVISGCWDEIDVEKAKELGCRIFDKYNSPEMLGNWIGELGALQTLH